MLTMTAGSEDRWQADGAQSGSARPIAVAGRSRQFRPHPGDDSRSLEWAWPAIAIVAALVVPAAWRSAGTEVEASGEAGSLLTLVNQARSNAGLAPLDYASDLSAIAAERASIMANSGSLTHTPDIGGRACCWTWLGENVAYAGSVQRSARRAHELT